MGWFSDDKVITTNSTSVLLIKDTPNLIGDAVFNCIVNDRPIVPDLQAAYLNCAAIRSFDYYNYGASDYYYGLPEGTFTPETPHQSVVKDVIDSVAGGPTLLEFYQVEPCNAQWIASEYLRVNRSWNQDTDVVGNPPTPPTTPNGNVTFVAAWISDVDRVTIQYSYIQGITPKFYTEVITADARGGEIYYHAGYRILDSQLNAVGDLRYFNYRASLGTYPQLNLPNREEQVSRYYPVVPVCLKGTNLADRDAFGNDSGASDDQKRRFNTSETILKKLDIDYVQLGQGLFNPDAENPNDPANLDYGFVVIGPHLGSNKEQTIKYFYDYFDYLSVGSIYTKLDYEAALGDDSAQQGFDGRVYRRNEVTVQEQNYKMTFSYTYIEKELLTGNIGDIGTTTREIQAGSRYGSYVRFNRQVTPTQYYQLTVYEPHHSLHIEGGHTIENDASQIGADGNDDWVIPLNMDVAQNFGTLELNTLMYDSIRLVINSITETSVPWYQTGLFKIFTIVIMVAITVFTSGATTGGFLAVMQTAGAAAIKTLIIAQIVSIGVGFVLDVIGIDNKYLTMLIAVAVTVAIGYGMENIGFTEAASNADTFMTAVNGASMGFNYGVQKEMEDLAETYQDEKAQLDEENDYLQEQLEMFHRGKINTLAALDVGPSYFVSEDPTGYYTRSLNQNPGLLSLQQIETYTERALDLPGVNDLDSLSFNY